MKIRTEMHPSAPPACRWSAIDDDDSTMALLIRHTMGKLMGWGFSEDGAIDDLMELKRDAKEAELQASHQARQADDLGWEENEI